MAVAEKNKILFSNKDFVKNVKINGVIYAQKYQIIDGEEVPLSIKPAQRKD